MDKIYTYQDIEDIYNLDPIQKQLQDSVTKLKQQYLIFLNTAEVINNNSESYTKRVADAYDSLISQQTKFFKEPDKNNQSINKGQVYFY